MSKISDSAAYALENGEEFNSKNTKVLHLGEGCWVMRLHRTTIAKKWHKTNELYITTGGWDTKTTKSRLNALHGVRVSSKAYELYLNDEKWDGNLTKV